MKGVLIDLPDGTAPVLESIGTDGKSHTGYRVYPVPEKVVKDQGSTAHVAEVFAMDAAAYAADAFYPEDAAALGTSFMFRGHQRLQVMFYPLSFNGAAGELVHYSRIRVRIAYEDALEREATGDETRSVSAWRPPTGDGGGVRGVAGLAKRFAAALWTPASESTAYKISVASEGIYRLSQSDLSGAGINVGALSLSEVRLYNLGQEIAIYVYDEDEDDSLDSTDYIEFYAPAVDSAYEKYTNNNIYWLTTSGGSGSANRMAETDGTPGSAGDAVSSHASIAHHELDLWYLRMAPGTDALDRWVMMPFVMGDGLDGGGGLVNFVVSVPGALGPGTLKIMMFGASYDTNHRVDVSLNNTLLDTFTWSGIASYSAEIEDVTLVPGNNTVTLQCYSGVDSIGVDWIEVDYTRDFAATSDVLKFTHDAGYGYEVTGLTTNTLLAYDITSAAAVEQVVNFDVTGSGPYTLEFADTPGGGERTYMVLTSGEVKSVSSITADTPSTLYDTSNGADYIVIAHADVGWDGSGNAQQWLSDLVSHRQAQGLRVVVADVEDVFDEFSYGVSTPQGVKDFITYAYENWSGDAPQYVVLAGDGTYDPKGNWIAWGTDDTNPYVPIYLAYTKDMGETATDEWFVRISGDDAVADLYIGRLPAKSATEAGVMVDKIISYENAENTKTWQRDIVLVADDETEDYEAVFEATNEAAAALIRRTAALGQRDHL
jgi:hypothetical protein